MCGMWLFHVVVLWPFINNGKEMNRGEEPGLLSRTATGKRGYTSGGA